MATTTRIDEWRETRKRLIPAMIVGTTLEWYDMFLYVAAAALLFGPLFFPSADPTVALAASFATFGVGYVARPLGAVAFGHVGDRYGRKTVLIATLILMGVSTAGIGLLPTYDQVGPFATVGLVVCRLLQGLAAGAEYAGALVFLTEAAPAPQRGFFSSLPGTGIYLGIILSSGATAALFLLPDETVFSWAWRLPFLASALLVAIGIYIRSNIGESPVFKELEAEKAVRKAPVLEIARTSKIRVLQGMFLTGALVASAPIVLGYSFSYSKAQGTERSIPLIGSVIGALAGVFLVPLAGGLTDRFGRKPVYMVLAIATTIFPFLFFWMLTDGGTGWVLLAHFLAAPMVWAITGVQAAYLAELFPARTRLSGVALSRELSNAVFAAPGPLVAVALVAALGGEPWLIAGAMSLLAIVCLLTLLTLPETRGIELASDAPGERLQ